MNLKTIFFIFIFLKILVFSKFCSDHLFSVPPFYFSESKEIQKKKKKIEHHMYISRVHLRA